MYRREFYLTVLILSFAMAQLWAFMVVLTTVRPGGPAELAMGLTLIGAAITVINGLVYVARRARSHVDPVTRIEPLTRYDDVARIDEPV
jgi:hypothetical protein